MYEIRSLKDTSPEKIFECFKLSFAHYLLAMDFTPGLHFKRWEGAGVDFTLSYGAFKEEELVGMILLAPKKQELFNLATGVLPAHRGNKLTKRMFEKLIPEMKELGFKQIGLEVITENRPALTVYEKVGFSSHRMLYSFKGVISRELKNLQSLMSYSVSGYEFKEELQKFMRYPLSFEYNFECLARKHKMLELHELKSGGELVAFAIFHPLHLHLIHLEAKEPMPAFLLPLLQEMKLVGERAGIINVDERNVELMSFLISIGLENYLTQYEMVLEI